MVRLRRQALEGGAAAVRAAARHAESSSAVQRPIRVRHRLSCSTGLGTHGARTLARASKLTMTDLAGLRRGAGSIVQSKRHVCSVSLVSLKIDMKR